MENYNQICVWQGCSLGDTTIEEFESSMVEMFNVRVTFLEEIETVPTEDGPGGRLDILFKIHKDDIDHFAIPRLTVGIKWWGNVLDNSGEEYCSEITDKYSRCW